MKKFIFLPLMAVLLLAGCSSNDADKLEILTLQRAQTLNSQLPIERGPLSILRALAQKNVIELMMIYNTDTPGAPTIDQLIATSINSYCTDPSTLENLDAGINYRIKVRNTRGQLMTDQIISKADCIDTQ
ncbi:type II secretion system pilot lipoprotein GspS-beta [Vibrio sp. RC27]